MTQVTGKPVTAARMLLLMLCMLLASVSVESKFITIYDNFGTTGTQTATISTASSTTASLPFLNCEADYILKNYALTTVSFTVQNNRGELFCPTGSLCDFGIQYDAFDGGDTGIDRGLTLTDPSLYGGRAYAFSISSDITFDLTLVVYGPSSGQGPSVRVTPGSRTYLIPLSVITATTLDNIRALQVYIPVQTRAQVTFNMFGSWANEIKGLVFKDTDRNGAFTAGERWYDRERVDLIDNSTNTVLDTDLTVTRGVFSFLVGPGVYDVCVRLSAGLVLVPGTSRCAYITVVPEYDVKNVRIGFEPPVISLTSSAIVSLDELSSSLFNLTFSRTGSLSDRITIKLLISGTASILDTSIGDDGYFSDGENNFDIFGLSSSRNAIFGTATDFELEGLEQLTFTLLPDPSYVIDETRSSVTFDIIDSPFITIDANTIALDKNLLVPFVITISRSFADSSPLTVPVNLGGSAVLFVDYKMNIPLVSSTFFQITIPASQTSFTFFAQPYRNSSSTQDTIDLTVLPSSAYISDDSTFITLSIIDVMPRVAISATDTTAAEGDSQYPVTIYLTLTGTMANVRVKLSVTGDATIFEDYYLTNYSIGDGLNYLTFDAYGSNFNFIAYSDDVFEGSSESATFTILPDPFYIVSPSQNSVNIRIIEFLP